MSEITTGQLEQLAEIVEHQYGQNIRQLSRSWSRRRIGKLIDEAGFQRFDAFVEHLQNEPKGVEALVSGLSINVTEMFRDPEVFKAIRERLFPVLETYPKIRIWCAGVASGEEVWSIAILLHEAGLLERSTLYATDFSEQAIDRARSGEFSAERLSSYEANYQLATGNSNLSEYLQPVGDSYRIAPFLLKRVVFATHNLATDASFNEFHLILCRNVLIYFDEPLTDRVIKLFAESLVPRGNLVLGSSEWMRTKGAGINFSAISKLHRLFRRVY